MDSYINIGNLKTINAELTNYCNAACPMCPRFDFDLNLVKESTNNSHTTLEIIKNNIGPQVLAQIERFYSCGVLGDGSMNPECLQIYEYVKQCGDAYLGLNTNGGARSPDFWQELGKLKVGVTFSIDGLEDTNHLYRRNVKWEKLMNNVNAFIQAGGVANWDFLTFKHNQHQLEQAEELSKKLGFETFKRKWTTRWDDFDSDGNWVQRESIQVDDYKLEKVKKQTNTQQFATAQKENVITDTFQTRKISCYSFNDWNREIYLAANGEVSPCCWLGDLKMHEAKNIIKDYKKININHTNLKEILEGDFFKELANGIKGIEGAYRLQTCYHTCGVVNA